MFRTKWYLFVFGLAVAIIAIVAASRFLDGQQSLQDRDGLVYTNDQYGFTFSLPETWRGYSIITDKWEGTPIGSGEVSETGPLLSIRHPQWTEENPRQDIPIMVFTTEQWESLRREEFHIGAAPIGPRELDRNEQHVFALPARYNFAFPAGYEEVDEIIESNPLRAESPTAYTLTIRPGYQAYWRLARA